MDLSKFKIAIVYDWIDKWGGVERVLLNLHELFPKATFYTSYYAPEEAAWAKDLNIKTSFIQKLPNFIKKSRILSLMLYPYAFESFKLGDYDVVISVTSSFAKAVITRPETLHICYILTPTRYFYDPEIYLTSPITKLGYLILPRLREWDYIAARRPDYLISISKTVKERVKKYYLEDSEIIYPPFDSKYWQKVDRSTKEPNVSLPDKNFLVVSRLEPYKMVDVVIEAFNKLQENLIIIGKGTQLTKLKNKSKSNITFLSDVPDEELAWFYKNAEGLIMPQEEEFGYVSLEAQYFGCPVIAYNKGGATESIINKETGVFFENQTPRAVIEVVERFRQMKYNLKNSTLKMGKKKLERFSKEIFEKKFREFIESKLYI